MKVAIKCESILLDKALNIFLKPYLASIKNCDFIVVDEKIELKKPIFLIGENIKKPFNQDELIIALNDFYENYIANRLNNNKNLEGEIENLTIKFSQDLVSLIKDYYEK